VCKVQAEITSSNRTCKTESLFSQTIIPLSQPVDRENSAIHVTFIFCITETVGVRSNQGESASGLEHHLDRTVKDDQNRYVKKRGG
jgi:hypothetical protein